MSEQKSTLSGVLFLGAALLYLKFDESRRRLDYVLALTLFLAALAAKTVTATLPAALLVIPVVAARRAALERKRGAPRTLARRRCYGGRRSHTWRAPTSGRTGRYSTFRSLTGS